MRAKINKNGNKILFEVAGLIGTNFNCNSTQLIL